MTFLENQKEVVALEKQDFVGCERGLITKPKRKQAALLRQDVTQNFAVEDDSSEEDLLEEAELSVELV